MNVLKTIVIAGGILIIVGFIFVFSVLISRALGERKPVLAAPATVTVSLPTGGQSGQPFAVGPRIAIPVTLPDGQGQILLLNGNTGALETTILLQKKD